jgi:hypothetical protein
MLKMNVKMSEGMTITNTPVAQGGVLHKTPTFKGILNQCHLSSILANCVPEIKHNAGGVFHSFLRFHIEFSQRGFAHQN